MSRCFFRSQVKEQNLPDLNKMVSTEILRKACSSINDYRNLISQVFQLFFCLFEKSSKPLDVIPDFLHVTSLHIDLFINTFVVVKEVTVLGRLHRSVKLS